MSKQQGLLKNARSPGSIVNAEHHDPSGSQKSANGIPATIKTIVADSSVKTSLEPFAMLWVVNRDTSVHYIFVGKDNVVPSPVTASNGMAIPPGAGVLLNCGVSEDDMQSMAMKTDSSQIHVTILEV